MSNIVQSFVKIVRVVSEKIGSLIIKNNNNEGDLIGPALTSVGGPKSKYFGDIFLIRI